jgi:hypothetical protein
VGIGLFGWIFGFGFKLALGFKLRVSFPFFSTLVVSLCCLLPLLPFPPGQKRM